MNRRSFLARISALVSVPALPLPAAAGAAGGGVSASQIATAKLLARAHNRCSPAMLQRLMRIDATVATELNGMLRSSGVISAAGRDGASMALDPLNSECVPKEALRPSNLRQLLERAKEKLAQLQAEADSEELTATDAEEPQPPAPL